MIRVLAAEETSVDVADAGVLDEEVDLLWVLFYVVFWVAANNNALSLSLLSRTTLELYKPSSIVALNAFKYWVKNSFIYVIKLQIILA